MGIEQVEEYWSNYFGVNLQDEDSSIAVVPHVGLRSFHGSWLFQRGKQMIISVPKDMVKEIEHRLISIDKQYTLSRSFVHTLFSEKVERIIGPVYQGYYRKGSTPMTQEEGIKIDIGRDRARIEFLKNQDVCGWEDSSIDKGLESLYGVEVGDRLVALATYRMVAPKTAFIGIFCDPLFRRKGYGRMALRGIVQHLVKLEYLIIYQTLISNVGSIRIAKAVGFEAFAQNLAVRFK